LLHKDQILHINFEHYKLANSFCRDKDKHGGSCTFVSNEINVRGVTFLKNLRRDKELEISATELVDFKIIVICIYRSPDSDVKIFLGILDDIISKIIKKGRFLVICGDLNINLLQENSHQKAVLSLLLSNNLLNTVACPTRVTTNSSSLIDVMIRNKICYHTTTKVVELGYSDHFAQVMNIAVKCPSVHSGETVRKIFSKRNN
jgi:hypothetical protein